MGDKTPTNPRELTQNPLKKIWMPCENGLPEKHISQRKGCHVFDCSCDCFLQCVLSAKLNLGVMSF
uniref:Uncharacterized protein n=1 Tax=Labrus bergylta TaxID=56723 RepID=A0A3Q3FPF9_9LABR